MWVGTTGVVNLGFSGKGAGAGEGPRYASGTGGG